MGNGNLGISRSPGQRGGGWPRRGWRARYALSSSVVADSGSISSGRGKASARIAHSSSTTSFDSRATVV